MSSVNIIAGKYGGIEIKAPRGKTTHPMSGRMRGALFNMLGDLSGLSVIDAFGGSGALGIEAASRGASSVTIVDNDRKAQQAIADNLDKINNPVINLVKANVYSWLDNKPQQFDIILADPPYDTVTNLEPEKLIDHLNPSGLLVLSHPDDYVLESQLELLVHKNFAGGNLSFYKNTAGK